MTTDIEPDLSVALLVSQLAVVGDDYGVMCLGCVGFRRLQCAVVHQQIIDQKLITAQHHACTTCTHMSNRSIFTDENYELRIN